MENNFAITLTDWNQILIALETRKSEYLRRKAEWPSWDQPAIQETVDEINDLQSRLLALYPPINI